jgi:hypothetical protein
MAWPHSCQKPNILHRQPTALHSTTHGNSNQVLLPQLPQLPNSCCGVACVGQPLFSSSSGYLPARLPAQQTHRGTRGQAEGGINPRLLLVPISLKSDSMAGLAGQEHIPAMLQRQAGR